MGGVFWGFAPVHNDRAIKACCWGIQVGQTFPETDALKSIGGYHLEIHQFDIGINNNDYEVFETFPVYRTRIPELLSPVTELQVRIRKVAGAPIQISQVQLNGEELLNQPIELVSNGGREWNRLKDTGYGYMGEHGSLSITKFNAK